MKEAKIGRAVMDADVFISLTHFKDMRGPDLVVLLKISEWAVVPNARKNGNALLQQTGGRTRRPVCEAMEPV